ncbi:MAG TPA: protease SohB [Gammaproteobacteria bacterium]|nr:protease SohB [Gammaproteobacteria bacterium]
MELLSEYGLFLLQTLTVVFAVLFVFAVSSKFSGSDDPKGSIRVTDLSKSYAEQKDYVATEIKGALPGPKKSLLQRIKQRFRKRDNPVGTDTEVEKKLAVVLEFKGDMKASQVSALREEVSAVLAMDRTPDCVLIKLTSPGGLVHTYGLAGSQLSRFKDVGIELVACVDTVAASGGYMMAVCADRIISAPFAILGSIGVVAQIPNINRFLKNRDVDVELHTAGTNKRTLTVLGENTPEGRKKFKEDLTQTHDLFKAWVAARRPNLDIDSLADGSIFYGTDALEKGLCDQIATSDDVLMQMNQEYHLISLKWHQKKSLAARLGRDASEAVSDQIDAFIHRSNQDFTRL